MLTEWLRHFADPVNPHVNSTELSPRYMPWYWLLTYVGLLFNLDSTDLMALSAVANYVLIVIGLYLFLKDYFRDPWAPLIGFIVIFFFWGVSWNWSNLYHLRSFFYVAGFPSSFVFAVSLFSFALVLKLLRRDGSVIAMSALLCALSALMFVSHPLTGVFGITACGLLALTESAESLATRLLTIAALALGALLAELWPYFSVWKLALGLYGSGAEQWFVDAEPIGVLERLRSGVWQHIFYNPRLILTIFGPTLLGLPICLWLLARREHRFIVFGAALMAIPYVAHPLVEVPLAHRFILFVAFFLQLAIVWAILQVIDAWNSRPRPSHARTLLGSVLGVIGVLLVFNIALLSIEFGGRTLNPKTLQIVDKTARLPDGLNVVELYTKLTEPLPEDAVVLSTPVDGWPLPTVKGKVVSLFHENPMVIDQEERYFRTSAFFDENMPDEERASLVVKYEPTHLLLNGEPAQPSLAAWLIEHAEQVAMVGTYRMYRLLPSATENAAEESSSESVASVGATSVPKEAAVEGRRESAKELAVADADFVDPAGAAVSQTGDLPVVSQEFEEVAVAGKFGAPIAEPLIVPPYPDADTPLPAELAAP